MVLSLAPNRRRISCPKSRNTAVSATASASIRSKQLPSVRSASSRSPLPSRMEARGAPPMPASAAKAEIARMAGSVTPTPVSAVAPMSGICPMYIRSTRLYSTLISCAVMAGAASRSSSFPSFWVASASVFCGMGPPPFLFFTILLFSCEPPDGAGDGSPPKRAEKTAKKERAPFTHTRCAHGPATRLRARRALGGRAYRGRFRQPGTGARQKEAPPAAALPQMASHGARLTPVAV